MDVQALDSAVSVASQIDPAQSQNRTSNPSPPNATVSSPSGGGTGGSPQPPAPDAASLATSSTTRSGAVHGITATNSDKHSASPSTVASINVSYRYVPNPVQVVVVFTNSANGQEIAQIPPEFMVKMVQFDHGSGELVDRNV